MREEWFVAAGQNKEFAQECKRNIGSTKKWSLNLQWYWTEFTKEYQQC